MHAPVFVPGPVELLLLGTFVLVGGGGRACGGFGESRVAIEQPEFAAVS